MIDRRKQLPVGPAAVHFRPSVHRTLLCHVGRGPATCIFKTLFLPSSTARPRALAPEAPGRPDNRAAAPPARPLGSVSSSSSTSSVGVSSGGDTQNNGYKTDSLDSCSISLSCGNELFIRVSSRICFDTFSLKRKQTLLMNWNNKTLHSSLLGFGKNKIKSHLKWAHIFICVYHVWP